MTYFLVKVGVTALLIAAISELARRQPTVGALLASLPLVSILGACWQAHGDERAFVLFIWRLEPTSQRYPPPVRLPFLGAQSHWRLARIDPGLGRNEGAGNAQFAQLEAGRLELSGDWLAQIGLSLPHLKAQTCLIVRAERLGAD